MTTVGNIGIGLLFLIILWILTLIIFVIAVRSQSNLGWVTLGSSLGITIILSILPTDLPTKASKFNEPQEKDFFVVYKYILLAFLGLSACIASVVFFLWHCIEPVRAPRHLKC